VTERTRVAIVGAPGYTGAEALDILLRHPRAEVVGLFGSDRRAGEAEQPMSDLFPRFRGQCDLPVRAGSAEAVIATGAQAALLATPHEASHDLAPLLLDAGIAVFDLSAAFRLSDPAAYPKHYGFEHKRPDLLRSAVYGLVEHARERLRSADLVAVPGCYPTSAILPLRPLIEAGAVRAGTRPIIDSTSGVSGAGRKPHLTSLFCEVSQQPYGVLKHRHQPEIDEHAGAATLFTPHLGPYDRGIVSTIHVDLSSGWTADRVRALYSDRYADEPFVRLLSEGRWPSAGAVRHTNFCDIACAVDEAHHHLIVVSAIDNLVKGAAGQAVQCLNVRFGLPETMGLLPTEAPAEVAR